MATAKTLPEFVAPMLAKTAAPFDSDEHLFEIRWVGTRVLAFVDVSGFRLMNRRGLDITERYPELDFLAALTPGGILDGEIVVLRSGKPDFGLIQSREQVRTEFKARLTAKSTPATCAVFDQIYADYVPVVDEPLTRRRERLEETTTDHQSPRLVLSTGVIGPGRAYFDEACAKNVEGVVAKKLNGRYRVGRRSDSWLKIKARHRVYCAIIGFVPDGDDDFKSLIIGTEEDGELRAAGKVGGGFDVRQRRRINELLWKRLRPKSKGPIVPCRIRGKWVEPGLYCTVSYFERTVNGEFRAPVFEEMNVEDDE